MEGSVILGDLCFLAAVVLGSKSIFFIWFWFCVGFFVWLVVVWFLFLFYIVTFRLISK